MDSQSVLEFIDTTYNISVWQHKNIAYKLYVKTEHWQHFRTEALKFAQYKCQLCNAKDAELNVHHKNYDNLGRETFNDVIVLCKECHEVHHGI